MIDPLDVMRYINRKEREMGYFYADWSTNTNTPTKETITYRGNTYYVNGVEMNSRGEITIEGTRDLYNYSNIGIKSVDICSLKGKFAIKKVVVNPKKNATTVIFEDGTVEVVKKSPDDPEADIFSVVAYAVAKHVYGSNSAFKREIKNCMIEISGGKE